MKSFAVLKQGQPMASRVEEILHLPDKNWSDIQVEFGMDNVGTATVTFLLTAEQLVALAVVAAQPADCPAPE